MWRKLVSLAIYISLYRGVPRDHRNPAPNLYKLGTTPINEYRSDQGRREIKGDRERLSAEPIRE